MTQQQIKNTLVFLQRCDIKGAEVEVFVDVINALNAMTKVEDKAEEKKK